ncbi:META domain-containing protein [Kribbella shirazensis]|uniref:Heat shock protein HslJ n=1 Tax=Kribbella shirazensis TaxID=1105143 RepID=A0A7X5V991_9ACTN|nr:META domain-containing protein [Kribbella shirazensis]NIK56566.1 heat shock protein HslJ [Kribbella shirazensis]
MLALIGTGLLALSACGQEAATGSEPSTSLAGRTFLSTSVTEHGKPRPDTQVQLEFTTTGRMSWNAGCNTSETKVSTADGRISLGKQITSTLIGCMGRAEDQDRWIGSVLAANPAWKLDGDKLVLTTDSTTISMVDKQTVKPTPALDGTKWTLSTIVSGDTVGHYAGSEKVWLTLNGERVTGSTGCNEFQGTVARSPGKLTFGELATTRRACTGNAATLESVLLKGLRGEVTYRIDGSTLQTRSSGAGLDFVALP